MCPKGNYTLNASYVEHEGEEDADSEDANVGLEVYSVGDALQFMAQYTAEMCTYHLIPTGRC